MKIAILGCGAIGSLFLGYLSRFGHDVVGIVKDYQKEPLAENGLVIEGVRGEYISKIKTATELNENVDVAIFATKINDLDEIIKKNYDFLKGATVVSTQNGIRADYILADYFSKEKIITSIVMFGATFYPPNKVVHNFGNDLVVGNIFQLPIDNMDMVCGLFNRVFKLTKDSDIKGSKYLKLFVNLNNCIPAILGVSMQESFSDIDCSRLAIGLNKEAYKVVSDGGITLNSLPSYPKERIQGLVSSNIKEASELFSRIMVNLSKRPLYGSILQSIKRGKKSEIDFINGEVVKLAAEVGTSAPLNEKIVKLVHKVEDTGKFLSKRELLAEALS